MICLLKYTRPVILFSVSSWKLQDFPETSYTRGEIWSFPFKYVTRASKRDRGPFSLQSFLFKFLESEHHGFFSQPLFSLFFLGSSPHCKTFRRSSSCPCTYQIKDNAWKVTTGQLQTHPAETSRNEATLPIHRVTFGTSEDS